MLSHHDADDFMRSVARSPPSGLDPEKSRFDDTRPLRHPDCIHFESSHFMPNFKRPVLWLASCLFVLQVADAAVGQQTKQPAASSVEQVAFSRATPAGESQTVEFGRPAARIGDEVEQKLSLSMQMTTTLRQGVKFDRRDHTSVNNRQNRIVTTTRVDDGCATGVRLQYKSAAKKLIVTEDAQAATPENEGAFVAQPVQSKTYLCQREPGENGKLVITYENGDVPPSEECEIVAEHMDNVGRTNPLAGFLAGKTLTVGKTIDVPHEVASKIFSLGDQFGEVEHFKLTLEKVDVCDGSTQAVFRAEVDAASSNASQMRMQVAGALTIDAQTCRTLKVDLTGPIAMSETRGSYSTAYQVIGTGQLRSQLTSTYRDAQR